MVAGVDKPSSGPAPARLPLELIRKIFIQCLEDDAASSTSLLLVAKASQAWLLPFVYHSIVFTTAQKLVDFHRVHDVPDERLSQRCNLVHSLWIGVRCSARGDLTYASGAWPMTILCRILWMCDNLQNLVLLHLDQNMWQRLEYAVPASLKRLSMGPVHGPFRISHLTKRPQLEHFTSADSCMEDDEAVEVATSPSLKTFRRMTTSLACGVPFLYTGQVGCVSGSSLERYEIVICRAVLLPHLAAASIKDAVKQITDDPRVMVSLRDPRWEDVVYDEFCELRREYFRSRA